MNLGDLKLSNILSSDNPEYRLKAIEAYAIESFAKEVDYKAQNQLFKKLLLDHSSIACKFEQINKKLVYNQEMLIEAQEIANLGSWDIYPETLEIIWSKSLYDILEIDSSVKPSSDLFFTFVHPDDLENVRLHYNQIFSMVFPSTLRYRLVMGDGRIKWVHLRYNSERDSKGKVSRLYGTIQDVSEMKRIEDQLETYNKHLEKLVEEKVQEISASQMATIYALIKLAESRDDDTGNHIERTSCFCRMLAEKARGQSKYSDEIDDKFIETIFKASPLHDIGKVGIPDAILLKPGKLTDEEFKIMKSHVSIGFETLSQVGHQYEGNEFIQMGKEITLYHHEKWDGSGYNQGLSGEDIPLSARIMAISDVYDALRSKRVYKEAFSHVKSLDIIKNGSGSHFDPVLVDVFVNNEAELRRLYDSIDL